MAEADSTVTYKGIPGFPGYRVGDDGSVWSCLGKGSRGLLKGRAWKRMRPRPIRHRGKVRALRVTLTPKTERLVHHLILECFVGPCPSGLECCHGDGDPTNNTLGNLRWDTRRANMADAARHGTTVAGERNHFARLKATDVVTLRARYAAGGVTLQQLASEYHVNLTTVQAAVTRRSWKHI